MTREHNLGYGRGDLYFIEDPTNNFYSNVSMVTLAQPAGFSVLIGDAGQMLSNIIPFTAKGVMFDVRLASPPAHGAEVQFRQSGEGADPWDVRAVKAHVGGVAQGTSYLEMEIQEEVLVECDWCQRVDFRVQPAPGYLGDESVVSMLQINPVAFVT